MSDFLVHLVDAPWPNILILAGLAFLGIGVVGKISGKIDPGTSGRVMSAAVGAVLLIAGVYAHSTADTARSQTNQGTNNEATPTRPKPLPEKLSNTPHQRLFSGSWKNDSPQTRGITRLEVQQEGEAVDVHAWGACSPQDCDWGTQKGVIAAGSASIAWDQGFVLRKMTLTPDAGRLRMEMDSVFRDKRSPQHAQEYFVRSE